MINGLRPPVEKLIKDSIKIKDPDLLYKYVKDITIYYSSEYKTNEDILNQFKNDIKGMVKYYQIYRDISGIDEKHDQLFSRYGMETFKNKNAEIIMRTVSEALEMLMYETSNLGIFLSNEELANLGLESVSLVTPTKQYKEYEIFGRFLEECGIEEGLRKFRTKYPTLKPSKILKTIYDVTMIYYSIRNGNAKPTQSVLKAFKLNQNAFNDFATKAKGKDIDGIVSLIHNTPNIDLKTRGTKKGLFDFFIKPQLGDISEDEYSRQNQNFRKKLNKK